MLRGDENIIDTGHQVHRAAHSRCCVLTAQRPVREISALGNLHRAQDTDIDVTATDHHKAIGMMKVGRPGNRRDMPLAGIDQFRIFLARSGWRTHAQKAVFGVENNFAILRNTGCHHFRDSDPQIDD